MLGWLLGARNSKTSDGLSSSKLFNEKTFYRAFMSDLRNAKCEMYIESPFVTSARTKTFLPMFNQLTRRGIRMIVNTRHPDEHDNERSRLEAIDMIAVMQEAGIKVLYTGRLHRKIAIIDRTIMYEGSLNILSQLDSSEMMRRIESAVLSRKAIKFLDIKSIE